MQLSGCGGGVGFCHEGDQVLAVFFGDWRFYVFIVCKERRENVFDGLPIGVAHGIGGSVGAFGQKLVCQSVALAIASYDAANLPEAEVVEEFAAGDADFAHEQLVDVVGAG